MELAEADVRWRGGAPLLRAGDASLAAGGAFLRREAAGERLAVLTLAGARGGRRQRLLLAGELLGLAVGVDAADADADADIVAVASVALAEEDVTLVLLDAVADPRAVGVVDGASAALAAAVCALSSLVLLCEDGSGGGGGGGVLGLSLSLAALEPAAAPAGPFPAAWPPFRALAAELLADWSPAEVLELLPRALTLDLSPDESLAAPSPSPPPSSALDDLLALRGSATASAGVVTRRRLLKTGLLPFARPLAPVKRFRGSEVTGETLHGLLDTVARLAAARDPLAEPEDAPLDLGGAWDELVEARCRAAAEDALATYVDCLQPAARESPPAELDAFAKLHADISRLSLDVFHAAAAAFPTASARRRAVRRQLKADMAARYEQELAVLRGTSRAFCEALRAELWGQLRVQAEAEADPAGATLRAVREFDAQYAARARGPEWEQVLRDFYRQDAVGAFERLQRAGAARASEEQLRELRERLERDAEARKQALTDRFAAQEAQLRAGLARERETMLKMQSAKQSRAKMDEREAARARDAVAALERCKSELEARVAALEQAREDAQVQRARMERQVGELEVAARREMASRAELVDTLAATIKAGEEKERALQEQVAALSAELGEKTFRVEGELQELARQLRKTGEERDELQRRLGDVFLRVTALPPAVQQHVFCAAEGEGERVRFADALASFMSE